MLQTKRARFRRPRTRAEDLHWVSLPGCAVQHRLAVRSKSCRADFTTPKGDLVVSRVRRFNAPQSYPGDQPGARSHEETEANQGRRDSARPTRRRRCIVTCRRDGWLGGAADPDAGRIRVAFQPLEIRPKLCRGLASQLAVLLQSLVYNELQLHRQSWVHLYRRGLHIIQDLVKT